jgi:TRAP transporter TAXI family solute receptor
MRAWGAKLHHQHTGRSVKMIKDGIIEGKFHVGTIPDAAWDDLFRNRQLKILAINSEKAKSFLEERGYERKVIPAGSYKFTPKDIPTLGVPNLIVIRTDVSDETAYHVARSIWEHQEFLHSMHPVFKRNVTKEVIAGTYKRWGNYAHPGAVKYWKEQGIVQ